MNKKTVLTLVITALIIVTAQAMQQPSQGTKVGRLEDIAMVKQEITIPRDWISAKKLFAEEPQIGANVTFAFDMNAVTQEFTNTVKVYLGNNDPKLGQQLATEILRFFKIAFRNGEKNQHNELVVAKVAEIEALTNKEGDKLLAKAKALNNDNLAIALKQFFGIPN